MVSGTTVRFASLVAAILGTSTYAFSRTYTAVPSVAADGVLTYARCGEILRRQAPSTDLDLRTYAEASDRVTRLAGQCVSSFERTEAAWLLAGLTLLLAVAAVLYLAAPWWIRRRRHLVPVTAAEFPQLTAALAELSRRAGLPRVPDFVLDPVAATPGGLTYGRIGRYAVLLNAGLVLLRLTNPAVFRAIVLHELAHIRNRDVDLGYATVALWRAFVALALVPMVVVTLHPGILRDPWSLPWSNGAYSSVTVDGLIRAGLFVVIVYLTRNAVLRTRETYADARASDGADTSVVEGLRRAVSAGRGPSTLARRWRRQLGVHPDPQVRLRAIADPTSLLRPGVGEMFAAGLTTVIAASTIAYLANLGLPHTGAVYYDTVAIVIAPLAVGMLTAAAWRTELLSSLRGRRVSTWPAVLGFSLGWLLGDLAAITNSTISFGVFGGASAAGRMQYAGSVDVAGVSLSAGLISALLLIAGMASQAGVSATAARGWLPTLRGAGTRWAWAAGVVVTAVPFAVWYAIWFQVHGLPLIVGHLYHWSTVDFARLGQAFWPGPGNTLLTTVYPPLTFFSTHALAVPVVLLSWLYPFAAYLVRPRRRGAVESAPPRPRLELRSALLTGVGGVGAFLVILLVVRAGVGLFTPDRAGAVSYLYLAAIALGGLIAGLAGGRLAAGGRPLGLLLGQLAAAVIAVGATMVYVVTVAIGGCATVFRLQADTCGLLVDPRYAWDLFVAMLLEAAIAALIVGGLVVVVTTVGARLPARLRSPDRRVRSTAVVGTVLVLLAAGFGVANATYAVSDAVVLPGPPGSTVDEPGPVTPTVPPAPPGSATGRELTTAEVTAIADRVRVGLPDYWIDDPPSSGSDNNVTSPARCTPLTKNTYIDDLDPDLRASAGVSLTNGGEIAVSYLRITVSSYATPVPTSLFTTASTIAAACPRFSVTTTSDRFDYQVHITSPPPLGDQAFRLDYDITAVRLITLTAHFAEFIIRIGHTLITTVMQAINEPFDEELFLAALNRVVAAVP